MQFLMSDPKQQEQDSWKALQAELGLIPEEPKAKEPATPTRRESTPEPAEPEPPASMWGSKPPVGSEPLAKESPFIEGSMTANVEISGEAESAFGDEPEPTRAESENEVEMGEAPEEIPEAEAEAETEEEKRPRRRRGRRRRRSEGGQRDEPAEERESPEEPAAEEEQGDEAGMEEDEEEVEAEPFADFSVPSWQELIGSLYRPDR
jgi:ribonuclease E